MIVDCEPSLSNEDTLLEVDVLEALSFTFHGELVALLYRSNQEQICDCILINVTNSSMR
jgi:hypothetical protein